MYEKLVNKVTKNKTEIPLVYISLNLHKHRENNTGSCNIKVHPTVADETVKQKVNELIDYIRDNYDMEDLV